ncbi:hypothetical protein GCM10010286_60640 [Streptomyces toxytricini]|nr:hypothetical protein GCM10010286_60640 [Streptomyces toxytricini]
MANILGNYFRLGPTCGIEPPSGPRAARPPGKAPAAGHTGLPAPAPGPYGAPGPARKGRFPARSGRRGPRFVGEP